MLPIILESPTATGAKVKNMAIEESCFEQVIANHTLAIPPKYMNNLMQGITDQLTNSLLVYNEKLAGVPLTYHKLKLQEPRTNSPVKAAPIIYGNPCIHIPVKVHWCLFTPKPCSILSGRITMIAEDHISLLVLEYFSATIEAEQMQTMCTLNEAEETWTMKNGENLCVDQDLQFKVLNVCTDGGILSIKGSLDALSTFVN